MSGSARAVPAFVQSENAASGQQAIPMVATAERPLVNGTAATACVGRIVISGRRRPGRN
jgi:hypothetical protein